MKISIGRQASGKKYLHNLERSGVTTNGFGFVQPIQCRELIPQDHVKIRSGNQIRLQPLVKPTYGRVEIKTYHGFVPISDIYHPFESLLAGKTYNGANSSYIPQYVPFTQEAILAFSTYLFSYFWIFKDNGTGAVTQDNNSILTSGTFVPVDPVQMSNLKPLFISAYKSFVSSSFTNGVVTDTKVGYIISYFQNVSNFGVFDSSATVNSLQKCDWFFVFKDSSNVPYICGGRLTEAGKNLQKILLGTGYNLNLGNQEDKSILKLCAYYKFWFDTFAVQRSITWKQTNCFKLLEYLEQYGQNDINQMIATEQTQSGVLATWFKFIIDLTKCYYSQSPDYVSAHISGTALQNGDSDRFTTYLQNPSDGSITTLQATTKRATVDVGQPMLRPVDQTFGGVTAPTISQAGLDALKQLYKYVNIKTAVGGKISAFMKSIFGADYRDEKESNFIGVHSNKVDISPVLSTAETSEGYLGEFAGQGSGMTPGETYDFTASCAGYLITMFAIVPDAKFAQGDDPDTCHIKKFDFFTPQFDAITLLPTRKSSIYNCFALTDPDSSFIGYNASFGNIPNYSEYKVERDLVSGELAMLSTQANLLPFNMSKILPYTKVSTKGIANLNFNGLAAGEVWRWIGLYRGIGNFDRIFVNSDLERIPQSLIPNQPELDTISWLYHDRMDDNFVVYFYIRLDVHSVSLPMSQSFQTDGFENSIKVEKA